MHRNERLEAADDAQLESPDRDKEGRQRSSRGDDYLHAKTRLPKRLGVQGILATKCPDVFVRHKGEEQQA